MFGLTIPDNLLNGQTPIRYWGARAIFKNGKVDLLPDRQTYNGLDQDKTLSHGEFLHLPFLWWLNQTGLPWLRQQTHKLSPDSQDIIHHREQNFLLAASPQASYGYLYIGAAQFPIENCQYDLPSLPTDKHWSGTQIPRIGDKVRINFNQLGTGEIVSFFSEHDYAGVRVRLDHQPDWHKNQGNPPYALVFGAEITFTDTTQKAAP